ncbi:MAG: AB hydrolase superfamily protein YdjP [Elusimicrobia bacterium]|nr:AB hydrolase superfamily protein YdjP [Elusimicrobiota bacterium]
MDPASCGSVSRKPLMLAFESTGTGPPLVFLHAFPLSHTMWEDQKNNLSQEVRLITLDFPGFGQSPLKSSASSMKTVASQVLLVLDHLRVEKFVVAGLSMGGYVMLELISQAPDRIEGAAFLSTRAKADSSEAREKRFKNIEFVEREGSAAFAKRILPNLVGKTSLASRQQLIDHLTRQIAQASPQAIAAALRGMADRRDLTEVVRHLACPALFLAGEEDSFIPSTEMENFSRLAPKGQFQTIPSAGHLINLEQPKLFNDLFRDFLKTLR